MELTYQCCVALCNPSWKQGKTQGNNQMKKKRRIGKEKREKMEKRMETMKSLEEDQKRNRDHKRRKHLIYLL